MKLKTLISGGAEPSDGGTGQAGGNIRKIGKQAPIQISPVILQDETGMDHRVFIDAVTRVDGKLIVLGWSTNAAVTLDLFQDTAKLPAKMSRHARGDVADALKLNSGDSVGFCLIADRPASDAPLELRLAPAGAEPYQTGPLGEVSDLTNAQKALIPELIEAGIAALDAFSFGGAEWREAVAKLPEVQTAPPGFHGVVEGIYISPMGNAVVFGWALHPQGAVVWLEDELRNIYAIQNSFRHERRDITDAFKPVLWSAMEAGFIKHLPYRPENPTLELRALTSKGVVTLSERADAEMLSSDPRDVAQKLFEIETEDHLFHRRAEIVDWPILEPVIKSYREELSTVAPRLATFGTLPAAPTVSIIIPLYKRYDFMEHQILEFCRDPFLRSNAEVIYVVDDPEIQNAVVKEADHLFRLYHFLSNVSISGTVLRFS